MKKFILTLLLIGLSSTSYAGEGVDVGGGNIDEYEGGEGYSPTYPLEYDYNDPYSYCTVTRSNLDIAIRHAVRLGARRDFAQARATLIRGIQTSLRGFSRWHYDYKPLTREALERALDLDRSFNNKCGDPQQMCQADRRSLRFLIGYLEHINNKVIPFEQDYHIPYRSRGWESSSYNDWQLFVSHYKDVAVALLQVYTGNGPDNQLPEAFGNDVYELRVAAKLFNWAAYDIRRDDMNRRYRCEISGLYGMSQEVAAQLRNGSQMGSNMEAVSQVRDFALDTLANVQSYGCYPRTDSRRW